MRFALSSIAQLSLPLLLITAWGSVVGCGSSKKNGSSNQTDNSSKPVGSGNSTSQPKSYEELSAEDICPAFIEDACRAIFQCPDLAEVTEYKNEEDCRKDVPCRGLKNFEREIATGHFTWDAKKAASCHSFLNNDLCLAAEELVTRSLQGVLSLCPDLPAISEQMEGEECLSSLACPAGTYCSTSDDDCSGTCTASKSKGEICDYDRDCAEGLPCIKKRCGDPPKKGEVCPNFYCEEGAECALADGMTERVCVAKVVSPGGAICESDSDCEEELNCLKLEGEEGVCSKLVPSGGGCRWTSDCESNLACVKKICSPEPTLGETCNSFLFGGHDCAPDLICDEDVCKTARFWGESCGKASETCAEGLCEESVCVQRKPLGATCEENAECRFRKCTDGICVDPVSCQ